MWFNKKQKNKKQKKQKNSTLSKENNSKRKNNAYIGEYRKKRKTDEDMEKSNAYI